MMKLTILSASALTACFISVSTVAQAMSFSEWGKLAAEDRNGHIDFMVRSAGQALTTLGREDQATKVNDLFTKPRNPGDQISFGYAVFEESLSAAQVHDAKNPNSNPAAGRLQLEAVMAGTLKNLGIDTNPAFLKEFVRLAGAFKPKFPIQK